MVGVNFLRQLRCNLGIEARNKCATNCIMGGDWQSASVRRALVECASAPARGRHARQPTIAGLEAPSAVLILCCGASAPARGPRTTLLQTHYFDQKNTLVSNHSCRAVLILCSGASAPPLLGVPRSPSRGPSLPPIHRLLLLAKGFLLDLALTGSYTACPARLTGSSTRAHELCMRGFKVGR